MFNPKYTITDKLLANITKIDSIVRSINNKGFPHVVFVELEKAAREVSVHASTSIEGNPLPLTEVKKILKTTPENIRDTEKEVLNYNNALQNLNQLVDDNNLIISLKLILDTHKQIMQDLLPISDLGKLRNRPIIVNDPRTRKTVYLPPDVSEVEKLVKDLIEFIEKSNTVINPLILAGIFHKQMVIIHPFIDGNGRTTRLIAKILLAKMELNTFNLFSFENYYNKNITKYFSKVGVYGDYNQLENSTDFTAWLEYFTDGIIDELFRVQELLPEIGKTPSTRLENYHLKILEYIKKNGFITDREYSKLTQRAKATRVLDFQRLMDIGLIERKGKGRSVYYTLSN